MPDIPFLIRPSLVHLATASIGVRVLCNISSFAFYLSLYCWRSYYWHCLHICYGLCLFLCCYLLRHANRLVISQLTAHFFPTVCVWCVCLCGNSMYWSQPLATLVPAACLHILSPHSLTSFSSIWRFQFSAHHGIWSNCFTWTAVRFASGTFLLRENSMLFDLVYSA